MMRHKPGDRPKWPVLYYCLFTAYEKRKCHDKFIGVVYHGINARTVSDMDQIIGHESNYNVNYWVSGFVLPTFFSTSKCKQIAIDFAAGEGGTVNNSKNEGMILKFNVFQEGIDVSWISKFPYEEEILLPPWLIAAPDFGRTDFTSPNTTMQMMEYIYGSPHNTGNTELFPSVYRDQKDAQQAVSNCASQKTVTSSRGNRIKVQYLKLVVRLTPLGL